MSIQHRDDFIRQAVAQGLRLHHDGRLIHPSGHLEPRRSRAKRRGYWKSTVTLNGEAQVFPTARLTCWLTCGEPPSSDIVVDHISGNTRDDRPRNLRWVTASENVLNVAPVTRERRVAHAAQLKPAHVLTAKQVQQVRDALAVGFTRVAVARHFGISPAVIRGVAGGTVGDGVPHMPVSMVRPVDALPAGLRLVAMGGAA